MRESISMNRLLQRYSGVSGNNWVSGGYDYEFIKIGHQLLTFDRFKYDEYYNVNENFEEFAIKAYKEYGFIVLYICEKAKFEFKKFYASFSREWNYLPNYAGEEV
jgi:hypothetical protein